MEVHNEVGVGLKVSLLIFVLILIGTLAFFVVHQNEELGLIYASGDGNDMTVIHNIPAKVDSTSPPP